MKLSKLTFRPIKHAPSGADTVNHRLLVQAGFVRQLMAGVYTYTPLGLRVLRKIENIIRQEMDAFGSQEVHMPALHPKANWVTTGAWDSVDVLFKIHSRTERDYALGQSHEEIVVPLVQEFIHSAKDLPSSVDKALSVYQIQWKFRDELRAKSGILRGREFLMKDMYSFHASHEDFLAYYAAAKDMYLRTFQRLGLDAKATEASGGSFTDKKSYEFMVLTDAGEDDILYCDQCEYCTNIEVAGDLKAGDRCPKCQTGALAAARASEAGNIFDLGTAKSAPFDMNFIDSEDKKRPIYMGCYGIGVTRAMGIIVEKHADEKGIVWPKTVAPAAVYLINLGEEKETLQAENLYQRLNQEGIDVIWDDRSELTAGGKFASADLIGCPWRVVISPKTDGLFELKSRSGEEKAQLINEKQLIELLQKEAVVNDLATP